MRGIGHATAIAFASLGADVVVTGTGRAPSTFPADEQAVGWRDVESVAEEIRALGRRALPMKVDVSSGALYTFTAIVAKEVASHGIRVNCVSPGTTDTARNDSL